MENAVFKDQYIPDDPLIVFSTRNKKKDSYKLQSAPGKSLRAQRSISVHENYENPPSIPNLRSNGGRNRD